MTALLVTGSFAQKCGEEPLKRIPAVWQNQSGDVKWKKLNRKHYAET